MQHQTMRTLIPADRIRQRVAELGEAISRDFAGETELVVISVLDGAFMFTADLVRHLALPCRIAFIRASSYGSGRHSSGTVLLQHDLAIGGAAALLVEDIVDTGLTLSRITETLLQLGPKTVRCCCLLDKPSRRSLPLEPDYIGFTIPDLFVVGYGMDLAGRYRELPDICVPDL